MLAITTNNKKTAKETNLCMIHPEYPTFVQCYLNTAFITKTDVPIGFAYGNDCKKQFHQSTKQDYALGNF